MFNFILTLVFLMLPIVVAAMDKKHKKEKRSPSVHAEPIDFSEVETERTPGSKILEHEKALLRVRESPDPNPSTAPERTVENAKPQPETKRKPVERAVTEEEEITVETVKKDRRKLILYSEILRPKFDE